MDDPQLTLPIDTDRATDPAAAQLQADIDKLIGLHRAAGVLTVHLRDRPAPQPAAVAELNDAVTVLAPHSGPGRLGFLLRQLAQHPVTTASYQHALADLALASR